MPSLPHELATRVERLLADGQRVLLGITGPPGAGKSTLAAEIVDHVGADAVGVPMDGFHLADVELDRLNIRHRKGAIETFDGYGYLALLRQLHARPPHIVYAPAFDRDIEQPVAGSIPVFADTRLVVTEGNYLLDGQPPWPSVRELLTQVWYVDAPPEVWQRRLVARHEQFGKSPEHALAWVRDVDGPNANRIALCRHKADLVLTR